MPFIYRGGIANIDRSLRRDDEFIHENMVKAMEDIFHNLKSHYIRILPTSFKDPPFDEADPSKFLTLNATKILDLNLYEVEFWLDFIADEHGFHTDKTSSVYIDERRRYYKQPGGEMFLGNPKTEGGFISTHVIYHP
jgi:hypothetical protein